jgi:DNA-binding NtrC family response regulator
MARKIRLLIVDDEERFLMTLAKRLSLRGFDVTPVNNGQKAIDAARNQAFDIGLVDLKMPGMSGENVLDLLKKNDPYIEVVILTGHGSIDSAVDCTKHGSFSYLQKPCDTEELLEVLKDAYQKRVQRKLKLSAEQMDSLFKIAVGESPLGILRRLRNLEDEYGTETGS